MKKNFSIYILIIFSLFFSGCQVANNPIPEKPEEKVSLVSDFNGWKTYTNKDWGIRFKFEDKDDKYKSYSEDTFIHLLYSDGLKGPLYLYRGSINDFSPIATNLEDYILKYAWKKIENVVKLENYTKLESNKNINGFQLRILGRNVQHPPNVPDTYSIFTIYYLEYFKVNKFDYISISGRSDLVEQILESFEYIK